MEKCTWKVIPCYTYVLLEGSENIKDLSCYFMSIFYLHMQMFYLVIALFLFKFQCKIESSIWVLYLMVFLYELVFTFIFLKVFTSYIFKSKFV